MKYFLWLLTVPILYSDYFRINRFFLVGIRQSSKNVPNPFVKSKKDIRITL
jgi:hypothetical protein